MNRYTPTLVWLTLCLIFLFIKSGCRPPATPAQPQTCCIGQTEHTCGMPGMEVKKDNPHFPLTDNSGKIHQYKDNFDKLIFPQHNKKLTQYCSLHFEWENITAIYKKADNENGYEWSYRVKKHPKSWK